MSDRVRIYELARKMNLDSQDIITACREIGLDAKSHSSTVDSQQVGLVIAQLGKKKQHAEGKTTKATKTTSKSVATPPPPPPPPPVVKPRVLSRYRPLPPPAPELDGAGQPTSPPVGATALVRMPVQPLAPDAAAAAAAATAAAAAPAAPASAAAAATAAPPAQKVEAPPEVTLPEPPAPDSAELVLQRATVLPEPAPPVAAPVEVPEPPAPPDIEGVPEDALKGILAPQRPSTPSVPIRIAAPSFRATPPRPPKPHHRPSPSDRHVQKKEEKLRPASVAVELPRILALTGSLTVKDLSDKMAVPETEIITRLMIKGHPRTINQTVELELARELAAEMGYELASAEDMAIAQAIAEEEAREPVEVLTEEETAALVTRPPVVTIMGHVDHGKTSLLDAIRQTKFLLTDAEHGGITQHIGAYHVEVPGEEGTTRQIVFLDTPGHEAFTAMRARGAKATDIAILVVAADDGVMPQTVEAIDHAKAAGVPIIVAINKMDLPSADPDRVLTDLMKRNILPDKYGGDTVTVNVSAKKRTGLDELLEMILLVADIQDLKANPDRPATGIIIESELSRGKGAVATALVQNGTLREGDYLVAGTVAGRVRALLDDRGERVKAAGPSMPVEVLGLPEVPQAGDRFQVLSDIQSAKTLAEQHKAADVERPRQRVTLESLHDLVEQGEVKELTLIVKADVQGTAEAIADQVIKLTSREVQIRVLRVATGDISENDVNLAASSSSIIIGFNVEPDPNAHRAAEGTGVDIRTYTIIYQIIDDITLACQGLLQPIRQEIESGTAEVRQLFKLGKVLVVAGCYVTSGKITRGSIAHLERAGKTVFEGKIETLKRFKDDVREVAQGFECGISFEKFNDVQEGDLIRAFTIQEIKRELTR